MSAADLRLLPKAFSDFEWLRECRKIYVDKTASIVDLANRDYPLFISRPRRFGKSLLLSTLQSLFSHGTRAFSGLAAEKLWHEKTTYSVLKLDFSSISSASSIEEFRQMFKQHLYLRCQKAGIPYQLENELRPEYALEAAISSGAANRTAVFLFCY